MSQKNVCPSCNVNVIFGQQRCVECNTWIWWVYQSADHNWRTQIRQTVISWPQKAQVRTVTSAREQPDKTSREVYQHKPNDRFVVIGAQGEFYAIEQGGWVPATDVYLFGALVSVEVVDPTGNCPIINVLNAPLWKGDGTDVVMYTVKPGDRVQVWEVSADWVRINTGAGHWLSTMWVPGLKNKGY